MNRSFFRPILDWLLEHAILFVLLQAPIFALFIGFFFKLVPYQTMSLLVFLCFVLLPVWISFWKSRSKDPEGPVHHLHRYALYALVPGAMFSVARMPMHFTMGMSYWHPWYEFGSQMSGMPVNKYSSLAAGAILYGVHAYTLGLGFYVLFRRHSLMNALLFLCFFLSSLYSFVFPVFGRVGVPSPGKWHFVVWWAHFWMALAAWYMPKFWAQTWRRLGAARKAFSLAIVTGIVLSPYVFAFGRAYFWQFPLQQKIDQEILGRRDLLHLIGGPILISTGVENKWKLNFQFGPRIYKNYFKKAKLIGAQDIKVMGKLRRQGKIVGWCSGQLPELPGLENGLADEHSYEMALKHLEFTQFDADCWGPTEHRFANDSGQLQVEWEVEFVALGDREQRLLKFKG